MYYITVLKLCLGKSLRKQKMFYESALFCGSLLVGLLATSKSNLIVCWKKRWIFLAGTQSKGSLHPQNARNFWISTNPIPLINNDHSLISIFCKLANWLYIGRVKFMDKLALWVRKGEIEILRQLLNMAVDFWCMILLMKFTEKASQNKHTHNLIICNT